MVAITAEQARAAFSYDPLSGVLSFAVDGKNSTAGHRAGSLHKGLGYRTVWYAGRNWLEHRIAWVIVHGEWPENIDHINGQRDDNRLTNLRSVCRRINNENRRTAEKNSMSGLIGAHWDGSTGKWRAQLVVKGERLRLGRFDTAIEAHQVYVAAKRRLHEGNTL